MLPRPYLPFGLGSFHSTGGSVCGSGRAVIGRAWRMANLPPASAHSMSIGMTVQRLDLHAEPGQLGSLRVARAQAALRSSSGTGCSCVPLSARTVITCFVGRSRG